MKTGNLKLMKKNLEKIKEVVKIFEEIEIKKIKKLKKWILKKNLRKEKLYSFTFRI